MKNLIRGLALLGMLLLCCCSKTIYTHEQVLDMYQTKAAVSKKFGVPTERKAGDSTEAWLYQYQRNSHTVEETPNTKTVDVANFNRYDRYLIFTFDKNGNVIRNDFKGVNLEVKKKDTGRTILLVAGIVGATVGLIAITSSAVNNMNFYQ